MDAQPKDLLGRIRNSPTAGTDGGDQDALGRSFVLDGTEEVPDRAADEDDTFVQTTNPSLPAGTDPPRRSQGYGR